MGAMETTTIEISRENWQRLNERKRRPGESFNEVLDRMLADDSSGDQEPHLPEDLDLPGSGDVLDARREAVARLYGHLRKHGSATKGDFLELVDVDQVGYGSRESFWSNCINATGALSSLPGVRSPGEGGHRWRFEQ